MLHSTSLQEYNRSSAEDSRMNFPQQEILPDDQAPNKEKRMEPTVNRYHLMDNHYMLTGNIHE